MERIEEEMQCEKISLLDYVSFLLEHIAWNTSPKVQDQKEYVERLRNEYASYKQGPAGILRDMRARSKPREGQVSQNVQGQNVGVCLDPDKWTPPTKNVQPKR